MKPEQFATMLDLRGCDRACWPAAEREAAEALLRDSATARGVLERQLHLERLLDELPAPGFPGLEAAVLRQPLPARSLPLADRILDWLTPDDSPLAWWRPAVAAGLPLALGIALSGVFSFGLSVDDPGYAYWDQELYLLSLYDYAEAEVANE